MVEDEPLLSPDKIDADGANTFPSTIKAAVDEGHLRPDPVHYVTKHLQQGIESDHFRMKTNMPRIAGFRSFRAARRTIAESEAMPWLKKGFAFTGDATINDQNAPRAASDFKMLISMSVTSLWGHPNIAGTYNTPA